VGCQDRESGIPTVVVIDPYGEAIEKIRPEAEGPVALRNWKYDEWRW
jgi:hypothetical protein